MRTSVVEQVFRDLRYVVPALLRSPIFTAAAVLTLALGHPGTEACWLAGTVDGCDR